MQAQTFMINMFTCYNTAKKITHWDSVYKYSATLKTESRLYLLNVTPVPSYIYFPSSFYLTNI